MWFFKEVIYGRICKAKGLLRDEICLPVGIVYSIIDIIAATASLHHVTLPPSVTFDAIPYTNISVVGSTVDGVGQCLKRYF